MGQATGIVLGVAGAVIGGVLSGGNPMAIEAGFMLGSVAGAILNPPKQPSPADVRVQDSAYGKYIPTVWGRYRMSGNMIWAGTPHSHGVGGKGMGGKANQPYTTMSFALGLCQGEVTAIQRIWANGQLIYDVSNPSDWQAISGSSSMVTDWTWYPGDENQTADPTMESQLGVGNVPAYRGLAYVVFNELNLQQWGNYLPSLSFEVIMNSTPVTITTGAQSVPSSPDIGNGYAYVTQIQPSGTCYGFVAGLAPGSESWAIRPFQMSSYGTVWLGASQNVGSAHWPGNGCTSYDEPGILLSDGRWIQTTGETQWTAISLSYVWLSNGTAIKKNGVVYFTTNYGLGNYALYSSNVVPLAEAATLSQSSYTAPMQLLCVTDDYIYCSAYVSGAYQVVYFDLELNYQGVLFTGTARLASATAYAVSDSEIYFQMGADGAPLYVWNGAALVVTAITTGANVANCSSIYVAPGQAMLLCSLYSGTTFYAQVVSNPSAPPTLASIVDDICAAAGLQSSQYTASTLTDAVIGYANTSNASPRDMLTPLLSTYFVDVSDSDGQLKFVRRGAAPAMTIPWDDLGASTSDNDSGAINPIVETVLQEFEMPASETLGYISSTSDYQTSTQSEPYPATTSNLHESTTVPVVLADNDAKVRVQAMLWERWSKRRTFSFSTSYQYLQLEPSDVVNLQRDDGSLVPVRINKVSLDGKGVMTFSTDFTVPQIYPNPGSTQQYTAQGGNSLGFAKQNIAYNGPTILQVMDLPPLRAQDASTPGLYMAACGFDNTWPGCYLDLSRDDVTFSQLMSMASASIVGTTTTALGSFSGGDIPDELSTVTVQLYNSEQSLSSVSFASFMNGANAALIGTEIVYFRIATQLTANTWQLSGFLRARLDTDQPAAVHTVGEPFVFLDPTKLFAASINLTDVGQSLYFETYLSNIFGNVPGGVTSVAPTNARLSPFGPALLSAVKGAYTSAGTANDIAVRWFRKARVNNGWYDGIDVPLDWSQESYQVTIYNSAGAQINQYAINSQGISWSGGRNGSTAIPGQPVPQAATSGQTLPPFVAPVQPNFVYTAAFSAQDGVTAGDAITIGVRQVGDYGVAGRQTTVSATR